MIPIEVVMLLEDKSILLQQDDDGKILNIYFQIQLYGFNKELYHNMSEAQHKSQGVVGISLMVQVIICLQLAKFVYLHFNCKIAVDMPLESSLNADYRI